MSDVFVSYKAEDRSRVRALVSALEADGLNVWWDHRIEAGSEWRDEIQRQLEAARCVIVVWSANSIAPEGRFVRDEASRAQRRRTYLPVRIDDVEPPLGFGETQAIALEGWKGSRKDRRYQSLLARARTLAGAETKPAATTRSGAIDRRALLIGGATLAAGAVGAWWWATRGAGARTASIAVLPFANLSGDPAQRYFADGIAEELRSALARIARLKVIGRTSSEAMRDEEARRAAKKLGVSHIITGSVRRSPNMVRVTAQLVDGSDGVERWSSTFDRPLGDVLAIQSEIAENVAHALAIELAPADRRALVAGGTRNAAAQDLFLKAQALAGSSDREESQRQALAFLDAAIALDPNYANAHATRALRLGEIAGSYAPTAAAMRAGYEEAAQTARRAIRLAPNIAAGYSAYGAALHFQLRFEEAQRQLERAYQLGRGDARMLRIYADFLGKMGKTEQALDIADEAARLDPLHPRLYTTQAFIFFAARRYREAEAAARRSLQLAPARIDARSTLVGSLLLDGRVEQAAAEMTKLRPGSLRRLVAEGILYARLGQRFRSDQALASLKAATGDTAAFQLGQLHAQRGEKDQAIAALEFAWRERDHGLAWLRTDPFLDPLRNDGRFRELESRLRFPA
ncbi:MAG TPA: TIR domain-containing protein [Sphingomicrobium sp.]|nr:TIR domain-containing protein [Sphingomicrobium sp.]